MEVLPEGFVGDILAPLNNRKCLDKNRGEMSFLENDNIAPKGGLPC